MKKKLLATITLALFATGCMPAEVGAAATTTTIDPGVQYNLCRENSVGRVAAIKHINDYYQTWAQAEGDVIVADVNRFVQYCSSYAGAGNVVKTGKAVKACFAEWALWLPDYPLVQGSCYAYWDTSGNTAGNDLPKYHSALLVSSR